MIKSKKILSILSFIKVKSVWAVLESDISFIMSQVIYYSIINTTPTFLTETSHWPTTRLSKVAKRIKRNILQNGNWKFEG